MSDTYQAVYDAVRSRISNVNVGQAVQEVARHAFDVSFAVGQIRGEFYYTLHEHKRPSVLFRPEISLDGNKYCALYGSNLMDGCAGFGDTAEEAMRDFDKNWHEQKAPQTATRAPSD